MLELRLGLCLKFIGAQEDSRPGAWAFESRNVALETGSLRFGWLVDERRRVRHGLEAILRNRPAGDYAHSVGAILNSTEGPFDLGEGDAFDSVLISLDFEIIQTGRLVAGVTNPRLFAHSLPTVAPSQGHAGPDGVAL